MTKLLQGILSSKGRRAVWEENNAPREAAVKRPESTHDPKAGADNTILCCGNRFTPSAHTAHLQGEHCADCYGGVIAIGLDDPWLIEQDARMKAERAATLPSGEELWRQKLIDAYFDERNKSKSRVVAGTSEWMAE